MYPDAFQRRTLREFDRERALRASFAALVKFVPAVGPMHNCWH
jgi:hypothetical protein